VSGCPSRRERVLHSEDTAHQKLALIDNPVFGKVLLLDEVTQVTTADEFIYHEMLAHVPIIGHGKAERVLIIGGGDCGLAEEVLKHPGVSALTQVEIDPSVVEFAKTHFTEMNAPVFDDPRFDLQIADGAGFVRDTDRRFDVVLVDSTDPIGPGAVLFTEEFYRGVRRCLAPGGILATQNGVPFLQRREYVSAMTRMSRVFATVSSYVISVPTYFGGHMALGWASDRDDALRLTADEIARRFEAASFDTRYYTPEVHAAAFALPRYIADALAEGRAAAP
jgi:spermidine synthase